MLFIYIKTPYFTPAKVYIYLMKPIKNNNSKILFNDACYPALNEYVKGSDFSKIFVLVDNNTHQNCLPYFLSNLVTNVTIEIIEIESGEINKNIDTCSGVWNALSDFGADRKSLMINLGGGVITDLGGFVACTFKRGIKYINVPTTLLSMVDASVGGKTGVDLGSLKNQIGVINSGDLVLIDTHYLKTLPKSQFDSGVAEMLKHGLITGDVYWNKMVDYINNRKNIDSLIHGSVVIKAEIVETDPNENGLRKTLNYGHTLGHAIESYFLENTKKEDLLHGEAIAIGMILATYISNKQLGFPEAKLCQIKETIINLFPKIRFEDSDYPQIIDLLKFDKKNEHGNINFVLLTDIGDTKINCKVDNSLILEAFKYYQE